MLPRTIEGQKSSAASSGAHRHRKVDAGASHHAGGAGGNRPGVFVERRETAGEDREQDENERAYEIEERVAVDEWHGEGEGDREGRETNLVVRIERLGPDAEDAHAHETEWDDKDPLPYGLGAGGERAFGVLCDHVWFPPPFLASQRPWLALAAGLNHITLSFSARGGVG